MRQRGNCLRRAALVGLVGLSLPTPLWAVSNIITPQPGYQAIDRYTSITVRSQDTWGNLLAIYDGDAGLQVFDRVSNQQYNLGASGDAGNIWNSFVTFSPGGDSIWVGYEFRIYEVTNILGTPIWNHRANMWYNFDLAFSGTTPYVSGLNSESYSNPNTIWRLDTSGSNNHTPVAVVGGSSAGLAFDAQGNLYYATSYLGTGDKLVRFSSGKVSEGGKTLGDAETLSNIPFPAYDTEVDGTGHVIFDFSEGGFNGSGNWTQLNSTLAVWNGTSDPGQNYDVIGTAGEDHWFTVISAAGNAVDGDGVAYLADGGYNVPHPGLAEIRPVIAGNYWAPVAGGGGTGTWDSTSNVWGTSAGSPTAGSSAQSTTDTLIFINAAGVVTVNGTVTVNAGLAFKTNGYSVVAGSSSPAINLNGATSADNTITTDAGVTATVAAKLTGGNGMTKAGAGTLILSGVNTYTGLTTVSAGTLQLGVNAQAPIFNPVAGADIQGGKMVFDYTSSSPASTIQDKLKASYNPAGSWTAGQFKCSTADLSHGLGWADDPGSSQVRVAYTYYGDATLDGSVDSSDLAKVLANYNQMTNMVWSQGDFNYDAKVDSSDLAKVLANYNQGPVVPGINAVSYGRLDAQAIQMLTTAGFSVVPEPSNLVLLGASLLGLLAYAWRRRK